MYILCCLKIPSFNKDRTLRVKLVCINHKNRDQDNKYRDVCPCLYGLDEETLEKLLDNSIARKDIISIEKCKLFEPSDDKKKIKLKEEREEEILRYLQKMPYEEEIWDDISKSWNISIDHCN